MSKTVAPAPPPETLETSETLETPTETEKQTKTQGETEPKKKRLRGDIFKRLRKDTERTVRESTKEIAKALLNKTLLGDVNCAKLLFHLLEKNPNEKPLPPFRDLADILNGGLTWDPNNP